MYSYILISKSTLISKIMLTKSPNVSSMNEVLTEILEHDQLIHFILKFFIIFKNFYYLI